ncbi:MAG: hypothetical protein M1820_010868 [Bogoriella megaspora]|nr:MAG: hypothetical protein M1820_010868 [Bogoriella megaspora]
MSFYTHDETWITNPYRREPSRMDNVADHRLSGVEVRRYSGMHGNRLSGAERWPPQNWPGLEVEWPLQDPLKDPPMSEKSSKTLQATPRKVASQMTLAGARTAFGLNPTAPGNDIPPEQLDLFWPKVRLALKEPFSEFFGTFIMILFGNGSVAQVLLGKGISAAPGGQGYGDWTNIAWGYGIGLYFGAYVAADSGSHLNPAITLANCLYRKMPWKRFPIYFIAQFLGGFVASGIVYANYINAIDMVEGYGIRTVPPNPTATANIFCTYPQPFLTKASQFFSEFICTTIEVFVIFALKDDRNGLPKGSRNWFPLGLLFMLFGLAVCFGLDTAYAVNLARDFAPRLMSYILGYGPQVWSAGGYYFWIPMVAPFCGAIFGGFLYDFFIFSGPESPLNEPWLGFANIWPRFRFWNRRVRAGDSKV